MKMKEVIDLLSKAYREAHNRERDLRDELVSVEHALLNAEYTRGENISLAEYNRLTSKKKSLQEGIEKQNQYCNGISDARELLMDIVFDTVVE